MTFSNHLNNHLKLDLVIDAGSDASFNFVADILAHRHLKSNEKEHFVFIKDTLTINYRKYTQEEEYDEKGFKTL
jgi:hypothetical protein